jgi:hypothetical protein
MKGYKNIMIEKKPLKVINIINDKLDKSDDSVNEIEKPEKTKDNITFICNKDLTDFADISGQIILNNLRFLMPNDTKYSECISSFMEDMPDLNFEIGDSFIISIVDIFTVDDDVYFKLSNDMIVSPLQLAQLVKFNQN